MGGWTAVPRDWSPSVGFDRATGMAWGGGYVGDGVSTTHLAGCTIADDVRIDGPAVIGDGVTIGAGSRLKEVIALPGAEIPASAVLVGAIAGWAG